MIVDAVAVSLCRVKTDGTLPAATDLNDASRSDLTTGSGGGIVIVSIGTVTLNDGDDNYLAVSADTTGNILVQSGAGIAINSGISTGSGAISIISTTGAVTQGSGSLISTTGAGIDMEATAGSVTMTDGSRVLSTGAGDVRVKAAGDIKLSRINAGTGNASLISGTGSILDNGDTHVDVAAAGLRLQAGGSVGELGIGMGAVETTVGTLSAAAGTGGISLYETDDLVIGAVAAGLKRVTAAGTVAALPDVIDAALSDLTAATAIVLRTYDGSVTITDGADTEVDAGFGRGVASLGAGNILISAGDKDSPATSDVTVGANVLSAGGAVSVLAADSIVQTAMIATTGASIDVQAASGSITLETTASTVSDGAENVRYAAGTAVQTGAINAGTGTIDVVAAAGSVTRNSSGILTGQGLRLEGSVGVGEPDGVGNGALVLSVPTVSASSGAGGIYLVQTAAAEGDPVPALTVGAVIASATRVTETGATTPVTSGTLSDLTAVGGGGISLLGGRRPDAERRRRRRYHRGENRRGRDDNDYRYRRYHYRGCR